MANVSKSPERNTFQLNNYLERKAAEGKTPDNDENVRAMVEYYQSWDAEDQEWAEQEHENDLEWDLRTTDWILEKVRNSDSYAQNLYAAMCNMRWQKREVWPVLKDEYCSYSWRYAGGIIADMRQQGDYIDWYCSGISGGDEPDVYLAGEDLKRKGYVPESVVTEEIANDLYKLGWVPSEWPEDSV